jgi:LAO/AO transport system kinase
MTLRANPEAAKLAEDVLSGSTRALSRSLTWTERGGEFAEALLECLYPYTGRARVVGITGNPGSGKSTLTCALARLAVERGFSVGVIAIDPSSPYSGGSILGDRIRMNSAAVELGVFVRSLAAHGSLGGLCPAAADSVDLLDAAGRNLIFVETVGVGQDEVDIMQVAHAVVVVSVPGLGDDIQMLKAGILEIADIHVVNKADREGADRVVAEICSMLALSPLRRDSWAPPVLSCVALRGEGVHLVFGALLDHLKALQASGELDRGRKRISKARVLGIARGLVLEETARDESDFDELIERVVRRELAPRACARALLARWVKEGRNHKDV